MIPILARGASLLALAVLCNPAAAETYCVSTANELRNAMQAAAGSTTADDIRIQTGIYGAPNVVGNDAQYDVNLAGGNDLDISGGWTNAGCTQQSQQAGLTLLDGFGQRRVFDIGVGVVGGGGSAAVSIRNLSIRRGSSPDMGGCLRFQGYDGTGAALTVERVRFSECVAGGRGGALSATIQDGQTRILGSLFFLNRATREGAAYLYAALGNVFFSSNTVVQNEADGQGAATGGVTISTAAVWLGSVANNIFLENMNNAGIYDLAVLGNSTVLRNNRLDVRSGTAAGESGTTDAPPQFVAPNDFRLQPTSAMRNGGYPDPHGGYPVFDLVGEPRPQGAAVDIGAFEFAEQDVIFSHDFELDP
jgi:hypothetical protein